MENTVKFPQQNENRITIWSNNSIPGYLLEKENTNLKKKKMHPNVHCSIMYNSQDMEAK